MGLTFSPYGRQIWIGLDGESGGLGGTSGESGGVSPPAGSSSASDPPPTGGVSPGKDPVDPTWLNPRLDQARNSERSKIMKDLGVKDLEEAKSKLVKLDELEKANLNAYDKLELERKQAQEALDKTQKDLDAANLRAKQVQEKAMFDRLALASGVKEGDIDYAQNKLTDWLKSKNLEGITDVSQDLYKNFFTDLKKDKPFLFGEESKAPGGSSAPPGSPPPSGSPPPQPKDARTMSKEEYLKYKAEQMETIGRR